MKGRRSIIALVAATTVILFSFCACQTMKGSGQPTATLSVDPASLALGAAIFKTPVVFVGSNWEPNEMVILDWVIPKGIEMPGMGEGEDAVGIGFVTADSQGNIKTTMGALSKVYTIFRGDINPETSKPDFKSFKPLPPGNYAIRASGANSDREAATTIQLTVPVKK
ncbi:MAG: hypothetical protein V2J25_12030 [Desulfatiglans sp.]|jgi:hypothetical protein|nr:hypothetical protein [Desulfatiglans sp.]